MSPFSFLRHLTSSSMHVNFMLLHREQPSLDKNANSKHTLHLSMPPSKKYHPNKYALRSCSTMRTNTKVFASSSKKCPYLFQVQNQKTCLIVIKPTTAKTTRLATPNKSSINATANGTQQEPQGSPLWKNPAIVKTQISWKRATYCTRFEREIYVTPSVRK